MGCIVVTCLTLSEFYQMNYKDLNKQQNPSSQGSF